MVSRTRRGLCVCWKTTQLHLIRRFPYLTHASSKRISLSARSEALLAARRLPRALEVALEGRSALVEAVVVKVRELVDIHPGSLLDPSGVTLAVVLAVHLSVRVLFIGLRWQGKATYE